MNGKRIELCENRTTHGIIFTLYVTRMHMHNKDVVFSFSVSLSLSFSLRSVILLPWERRIYFSTKLFFCCCSVVHKPYGRRELLIFAAAYSRAHIFYLCVCVRVRVCECAFFFLMPSVFVFFFLFQQFRWFGAVIFRLTHTNFNFCFFCFFVNDLYCDYMSALSNGMSNLR